MEVDLTTSPSSELVDLTNSDNESQSVISVSVCRTSSLVSRVTNCVSESTVITNNITNAINTISCGSKFLVITNSFFQISLLINESMPKMQINIHTSLSLALHTWFSLYLLQPFMVFK